MGYDLSNVDLSTGKHIKDKVISLDKNKERFIDVIEEDRSVLYELENKYDLIHYGEKLYFIRWEEDKYVLYTREVLSACPDLSKKNIRVIDKAKSKIDDIKYKITNIIDYYLKCDFTKPFLNGFTVDFDGIEKNKFNLWRGFKVTPKSGDVSLFEELILKNICDNDISLSKTVISYFAHLFQKPQEKPTIALLMLGLQGTGKDTLLTSIKNCLYESNYITKSHFNTQFNKEFDGKLLIHLNEFYGYDLEKANVLKSLISDTEITYEEKHKTGYTNKNFSRVIISTNHFVDGARIESSDRRFIVLKTVNNLNKDFFKRYYQWLNNGGSSLILDYLLNYDISKYNCNELVETKHHTLMKMIQSAPVEQLLISICAGNYKEELLTYNKKNGYLQIPNNIFYEIYRVNYKVKEYETPAFIKNKLLEYGIPSIRTKKGMVFNINIESLEKELCGRYKNANLINDYKVIDFKEDNLIGTTIDENIFEKQ